VDLQARVEAIVGQPVARVDDIPGAGGYTPALRRIATLADGSSVFVKAAVNDLTRGWLRKERRSYETLGDAPFLPRYLGCDDEVLVLEDLRTGHWPPPWRRGDLDRVLATLETVAAHTPPADADDLPVAAHGMLHLWSTVAADPAPFLGLGLCTAEWFDRSIDTILDAESKGTLDGDALIHFDVRSDNLCITADRRVVLIDWNGTARGRADFDRHCFAQSVHAEGGPRPDTIVPDADPSFVAMITGYFAFNAPLPRIPDAPRVRDIQLAQLRACLPWLTRLLDL
jgi:hypothetical protein